MKTEVHLELILSITLSSDAQQILHSIYHTTVLFKKRKEEISKLTNIAIRSNEKNYLLYRMKTKQKKDIDHIQRKRKTVN